MNKTLKELLKDPDIIGISEIAEFVCHGYDKRISDVVSLLDVYTDSIGRQHQREIKKKDREILLLKKQLKK